MAFASISSSDNGSGGCVGSVIATGVGFAVRVVGAVDWRIGGVYGWLLSGEGKVSEGVWASCCSTWVIASLKLPKWKARGSCSGVWLEEAGAGGLGGFWGGTVES